MRDYGKVHVSFWSSETTSKLSDDARTLALYLMTSPHTTIAGVFRLPDGYVCEDLNWVSERVSKGFTELLANGFANRCETTKWVWICKHLKWNALENPNQRKSAKKVSEQIPDECSWKSMFYRDCGDLFDAEPPKKAKPLRKGSERVSKPEAGTGTETGTEIKEPVGFADFWRAYPRKVAKGEAEKAWAKIKPSEDLTLTIVKAIEGAKGTDQWAKDAGKFIPHPATWLNGRRWEDEANSGGRAPENSWDLPNINPLEAAKGRLFGEAA